MPYSPSVYPTRGLHTYFTLFQILDQKVLYKPRQEGKIMFAMI